MTTRLPASVPYGRRSNRPSGDDREQAILETARRLMEDRPFAQISVDDLAKGAGLSRPTFYFYFKSKEAVLMSLVEPMIARVDPKLEGAPARVPQDPRKMFHSGIRAFFTTFEEDPVVARAAVELLRTNADYRDRWSAAMAKWIHLTAELIESERARGAAPITIPATDLATALNQLNESAMVAALSGDQPALATADVVDTLTHVWLTSIYGAAI